MSDIGVRIGSILLHDTEREVPVDEYGTRWKLTKLEGWFDGWESTTASAEQRSQADGAWPTPQYGGPRVVHVSGSAEDVSWDAVTRAWDRLLGQIPFRQLGTMRVSTGGGTVPDMTALVRQHERAVLSERYPTWAKFSLSLLAPDPRRYDSTSRTNALVLPITTGGIAPPLTPPITVTGSTSRSQATLVNDGNAVTYPVHAIVGPCPPARIANLTTSEVLRIPDAVPAGQTLIVDTLNGTGTIQGQARRVLGTQWGLVPGANELSFWADGYDADAQLLTTYRSAWK